MEATYVHVARQTYDSSSERTGVCVGEEESPLRAAGLGIGGTSRSPTEGLQ